MTIVDTQIPGYVTGTWAIDPAHSYVGFVIRHAMIAKVRGQFESVQGEIVTAPDVLESRVEVTVDAASFHTNNEMRNQHIRSADFLDAENFPSLTFTSTGIRPADGYLIDGDLTVQGVTKPVVLQATTPRFGPECRTGDDRGGLCPHRHPPERLRDRRQHADGRWQLPAKRRCRGHPGDRRKPGGVVDAATTAHRGNRTVIATDFVLLPSLEVQPAAPRSQVHPSSIRATEVLRSVRASAPTPTDRLSLVTETPRCRPTVRSVSEQLRG